MVRKNSSKENELTLGRHVEKSFLNKFEEGQAEWSESFMEAQGKVCKETQCCSQQASFCKHFG